jgi:hypothetical protein
MVKIRMDFVTNSSSSSFISISIKNQEVLDKLKNYEVFQELTGFLNEEGDEDRYEGLMGYYKSVGDTEQFEIAKRKLELDKRFLEYCLENIGESELEDDDVRLELHYKLRAAALPIIDAYLKLIENVSGLKLSVHDVVVKVSESVSGEVFGDRDYIEKEHGIICDEVNTTTNKYYDAGKGLVRDEKKEFGQIQDITEELADRFINGSIKIDEYFASLNTTEFCLPVLAKVIKNKLKAKGLKDEIIEESFGEYLKHLT